MYNAREHFLTVKPGHEEDFVLRFSVDTGVQLHTEQEGDRVTLCRQCAHNHKAVITFVQYVCWSEPQVCEVCGNTDFTEDEVRENAARMGIATPPPR